MNMYTAQTTHYFHPLIVMLRSLIKIQTEDTVQYLYFSLRQEKFRRYYEANVDYFYLQSNKRTRLSITLQVKRLTIMKA
jgi:hypothetical protein